MENRITKWTVDQAYNGSDHNTITFEIAAKSANPKKTRNWDKGDLVTFTGKPGNMTFYEPKVVTEKKLDNILKQMYKKLFSVLKKAYRIGKRNLGEAWIHYKKLVTVILTQPSRSHSVFCIHTT